MFRAVPEVKALWFTSSSVGRVKKSVILHKKEHQHLYCLVELPREIVTQTS